ncbi:hypothetical protein BCR32DRAFT_277780 [Anaeromyces robustus]|uniref:Uncharacterized protein n=1 Tax=Anaeromyces robustus TaxID=1754192 RepID=A0A1Y1XEA1_9FUNG|nr:hypothetical protein BCR32DRAFT_277780 [Anaeromyces robustus]|eukprot:ORX83704.1 hypothetical protein BCR32DRAFT_277780 [Anaeromyces robustus]
MLNKYKSTLLDIRTENGGDIYKWKHFHKIIFYDDNDDDIKKNIEGDLLRRLDLGLVNSNNSDDDFNLILFYKFDNQKKRDLK